MGRHRRPETHKPYQIEQMWEIHHEIVRLAIMGMKSVDIAKHLSVSPAMVSYVLRSPIVDRQLKTLSMVRDLDAIDISKDIMDLAPRAVQVLDELLDNELPNIKLKAAQDILDRAGYSAVKTIRHSFLTPAEISEIKKGAKEVGLLIEDAFEQVEEEEQQDIAQNQVLNI